jgi:hypothetical protein
LNRLTLIQGVTVPGWNIIGLITCLVSAANDPRATALVKRAADRMGGEAVLQAVERVNYSIMTEWSHLNFDVRPFTDLPSFEEDHDVRDYTIPGWRNTRASFGSNGVGVDIVRDSIGARYSRNRWSALNVAYVDERRELFTYTPDRLMLHALHATNLVTGADTMIGGMAHARVSGTINGYPATIFFRKNDGLPAMFRFRTSAENDFGLTALGAMNVEIWYSHWTTLPNRMAVPWQWDVVRAGRLYKRLTVVSETVNPAFAADSFAVADSLRTLYLATQRRPMYDVPLDSARLVDENFAMFGAFGPPAGAIHIGSKWLLLESGTAPLNAQRSIDWLERTTGQKVAGAVLTTAVSTNGGLAYLTERGIAAWVAPATQAFARVILANRNLPVRGFTPVNKGQWIRIEGDSVRLQPFDFPNARGSALVYVPSLHYLYSGHLGGLLELSLALEYARTQGWAVERVGTLNGLVRKIPQ